MVRRSRIGCGGPTLTVLPARCPFLAVTALLVMTALLGSASAASAQLTGLENGEWHYLGGDAGHTRSAPQLTQINASNFSDLRPAWIWVKPQKRRYVSESAKWKARAS